MFCTFHIVLLSLVFSLTCTLIFPCFNCTFLFKVHKGSIYLSICLCLSVYDWFLSNKEEIIKFISDLCCHFTLQTWLDSHKVAELFLQCAKLLLGSVWSPPFPNSPHSPTPEAIQGPKSHNDSPVSPWQGLQKAASFNVQYNHSSVWQPYTDYRKHTDKWFILSQRERQEKRGK